MPSIRRLAPGALVLCVFAMFSCVTFAADANPPGGQASAWPERLAGPYSRIAPDEREAPRAILLEAASFTTEGRIESRTPPVALPHELRGEGPAEGGWLIVQFDERLGAAERRAILGRHGALVGPVVPRNALLARVPAGVAVSLAEADGVTWVGRYHPAFKVSPHFQDADLAPWSEDGLRVRVTTGLNLGPGEIESLISELGLAFEGLTGEGAYATARTVQDVIALARHADVLYVEPYEAPRLLNDQSRGITQSSEIGFDSVHLQGVRGADQIVAVMDSGLDVQHCCFDGSGKVVDNRAWGGGQLGALCGGDHGTHVSGTVACANAGDHDGLAPDAQLIMQDIQGGGSWACLFGSVSPPSDLSTAWSDARTRGAFVHTNSWGGGGNSYGGAARSIDEFMWQNQDFLILYAAGNSGSREGSLGSYSNAKNSITVGGTVNGSSFENMYNSSSRGPAGDGRMLPDLLTPAQGVSSARNRSTPSCGWTTYSGTSMATPAAAGSAALVREYYVDGYYPGGRSSASDGFTPSAALVKATLLASTRNMLGTGTRGDRPNSDQGFGRVTVDDALWFDDDPAAERLLILDDRNMTTGLSANGQSETFTLEPTSLAPVKLMLVWTDAPGAAGAAKALVNDLDLVVESAGGRTFRGNQGFSGGWTVFPSDQADRLNNKEGVFFGASPLGPIEVTVEAASINDVALHAQDYALVAIGSFDPSCPEPAAAGPGNTLDVTLAGDDIVVSWAQTGAPNFLLYRGDTPDFMLQGPDPHEEGITDADTQEPGIQWRDAGAATSGTSLYYVAAAANACGELVP